MKKNLGLIINKFTNHFGIEIHRYLPEKRAGSLRSMYDVCMQAKKCGMLVNTIFDVGVANGTPELYISFPKAKFILVEPVDEFDDDIHQISKSYTTLNIKAAAGDYCGKINIHVNQHNLHGSSILNYRASQSPEKNYREVDILTLDSIKNTDKTNGPYLIKADVQGSELNVINGATELLSETEMIILETSFFEFMDGAPQFHDVIHFMKEKGFVVYDFIGGSIRPLDGALGQIDVAFVKENGILRQSHLYA